MPPGRGICRSRGAAARSDARELARLRRQAAKLMDSNAELQACNRCLLDKAPGVQGLRFFMEFMRWQGFGMPGFWVYGFCWLDVFGS